jgi:hypothetical protein
MPISNLGGQIRNAFYEVRKIPNYDISQTGIHQWSWTMHATKMKWSKDHVLTWGYMRDLMLTKF